MSTRLVVSEDEVGGGSKFISSNRQLAKYCNNNRQQNRKKKKFKTCPLLFPFPFERWKKIINSKKVGVFILFLREKNGKIQIRVTSNFFLSAHE